MMVVYWSCDPGQFVIPCFSVANHLDLPSCTFKKGTGSNLSLRIFQRKVLHSPMPIVLGDLRLDLCRARQHSLQQHLTSKKSTLALLTPKCGLAEKRVLN
jgi:hypothetical protein